MSVDWQPVLDGGRLRLRPLASSDWEALYGVASDPLIWEVHPAHDRWQEPVFRAFFADALAQGGAVVVLDKRTGRIVGSSRWQNHDEATSCVEIGWTFLARDYWGGDYNRELKRLMLAHALRWVETAVFVVGEDNLRSRRAMEKIGGLLIERIEVRQMADGPVRHVFYAIDRQGFASGPLSD